MSVCLSVFLCLLLRVPQSLSIHLPVLSLSLLNRGYSPNRDEGKTDGSWRRKEGPAMGPRGGAHLNLRRKQETRSDFSDEEGKYRQEVIANDNNENNLSNRQDNGNKPQKLFHQLQNPHLLKRTCSSTAIKGIYRGHNFASAPRNRRERTSGMKSRSGILFMSPGGLNDKPRPAPTLGNTNATWSHNFQVMWAAIFPVTAAQPPHQLHQPWA